MTAEYKPHIHLSRFARSDQTNRRYWMIDCISYRGEREIAACKFVFERNLKEHRV